MAQDEAPTVGPSDIRHQLQSYLADSKSLLRSNVAQGQQALHCLIDGRLKFTPRDGYYEFQRVGTVEPVLGG